MKILLTGVTGFVGSSLAPALRERGYEVVGLVRHVAGRYALGEHGVETVHADLNDHVAVQAIIKEQQPDAVIHLAALSAVSYSYDHPCEVIATNYNATVNLAESCRTLIPGFRQFIFASTSETYGNQSRFPIRETAPLLPNSPYSASKVAADQYMSYLWKAYKFPVTVMRPFNSYGRAKSRHFVTERIITQMLSGDTVRLGDPTPLRDMMYVDDHVAGYLAALDNRTALGEAFNLCTGICVSIKELAEICADTLGYQGKIYWDTIPRRPLDIACLLGDPGKAERVLGWKAETMLEDGIQKTVEELKEQRETVIEAVH